MAMLPNEFADLEHFAERWCLPSEPERYAKRLASSMPEMLELYGAVTPRAEEAMSYLEKFPIHDLPEEGTNLLHLLYSMIMVSFPAEAWGQPRIPDSGSVSFDCFVEPVP
ncbi:MAG TPA: hypothetical protein VGA71_13695 [Actinomycetota bacterium]